LLRNLGRSVGDRLDVAGSGITIVASFPGFGDVMPRLLVDVATAQQMPGVLIFDRLAIRAAQPELIVDLLAARFPDLEVQQALPLRIRALEIFDQTFAITRALTLLALLVACIGLYNALLGLRLNQQSTLLLLASMGVSDAEVRRIQLARGLGIGAAVLVFALPLGLIMGWLLCHVVNPRAFGWELDLVIAPSALAVPVVLGLLVIVVTSLLPAPGEKLVEKA
jgi:putative ABC transport system permease protein